MADGGVGREKAWSGSYPYDDPPPSSDPPPPPPRDPEPRQNPEVPDLRDARTRGAARTLGLACGRFMPLHTGHEHYIRFARAWVRDLTVILFSYPGDPIPGELRETWLRETFPNVTILHATVEPPARESPDFWARWATLLRGLLPRAPDYFFTGDIRAARIAEHLGATHVLVDAKRSAVPISATQIRERPLAHWRYLPAAVRPHYVRRVSLLGPESTGKSTLAQRIADHYGTCLVPEYARQFAESRGRAFREEEVDTIARAQLAAEDSMARLAERVLVCDTDLRAVQLWSERLFGRCPSWVSDVAATRRYHLTLVTAPDVPFTGAPSFDQPSARQSFHARCMDVARQTSDRVATIEGDWETRWAAAREAVDRLLAE